MSNLLLIQSLKNKSRLLTFLIVCSLLISENAFARYGEADCVVIGPSFSSKNKTDFIKIFFKFFEYEPIHGVTNSYIQSFEVRYSTDKAVNFTPLMSASTENQTSKTWAWIEFKGKKDLEKIDLFLEKGNQTIYNYNLKWKDTSHPRLAGAVGPISRTEAWCSTYWYPKTILLDVTHILILGKWYNHKNHRFEPISLIYDITPPQPKLNSNNLNFSNSSPNQEISTEENNNLVKAYKEANAIVIEGALDEKIQVYTTTGGLVKSMVSNREMLQIPVPANHLYIVHVGKDRYMLAL